MARLVAALGTRIAAGVVIDAVIDMDGSAARGRQHRKHEHDERAFHRFPPKDLGLARRAEEESGALTASHSRSIPLVSAA
jgi:hypothetical protein